MSNIFPVLTYQDPNAAIAWLSHVFGFEELLIVRNHDGTVAHAELSCGPGVIMPGRPKPARDWHSARELPGRSQALYVYVEDVDAHFAHTHATGAENLWAPDDTDYTARVSTESGISKGTTGASGRIGRCSAAAEPPALRPARVAHRGLLAEPAYAKIRYADRRNGVVSATNQPDGGIRMILHNLDRVAGYQVLPDIVVCAANGELLAAVEVKAGDALSQEVVIALRSNLAGRGALSEAAFFLLVTQDRGFLWLPHVLPWLDAAPSADFPMQPVIERYLHGSDATRRLWEGELTLIVADWLHDLNVGLGDTALEPERTLASSGLLETMRQAAVVDATA